MISEGYPVRVELIGGKSIAGLMKGEDEENYMIQCTYKFVDPGVKEGFEDEVIEALSVLRVRDLLILATDLGVLRKGVAGLLIRTDARKLYEGWWLTRADEAGIVDSVAGAREAFVTEQKRGLCTMVASAMLDGMEPMLVAQQSPIDVVVPKVNIQMISSLIDEGQEQLFERWANGQ